MTHEHMVMRIYREDYDLVETYRMKRGMRTWIQALHELLEIAETHTHKE